MNLEKVIFGFFVLLAATVNFGFVVGDLGDPDMHNIWELYAAIVVNVDTATTVDAISPRGELLGGAFAPGIDLSVDALADRAAGLRKIELVRPRSVLGRTTVTALQAGVVIGVAGQIDALVDRLRAEVDGLADAPVVLTGGRAALVAPESRTAAEVRPHLGLEGLRSVFCRNRR